MFDKERIIHHLERTRVLTLQMIERVPHERWFDMPTGITHVAWNVGHIATAEYFLGMVFVRGLKDEDAGMIAENYAELFGYGSEPKADPDRYPTPDELMQTLEAVHQQLLLETRAMPLEELDKPPVFDDVWLDHHPFFEQKGSAPGSSGRPMMPSGPFVRSRRRRRRRRRLEVLVLPPRPMTCRRRRARCSMRGGS